MKKQLVAFPSQTCPCSAVSAGIPEYGLGRHKNHKASIPPVNLCSSEHCRALSALLCPRGSHLESLFLQSKNSGNRIEQTEDNNPVKSKHPQTVRENPGDGVTQAGPIPDRQDFKTCCNNTQRKEHQKYCILLKFTW